MVWKKTYPNVFENPCKEYRISSSDTLVITLLPLDSVNVPFPVIDTLVVFPLIAVTFVTLAFSTNSGELKLSVDDVVVPELALPVEVLSLSWPKIGTVGAKETIANNAPAMSSPDPNIAELDLFITTSVTRISFKKYRFVYSIKHYSTIFNIHLATYCL